MEMTLDSEIQNADVGPSTSGNFVQQEEQNIIPTSDDQQEWIEEIIEEQIQGKIILGNDGQFYVELEEGTNDQNIDLQEIDTVQILEKDSYGKKKLIFENSEQRDKRISEKARGKIEEVIRRKRERKGKNKIINEEQIEGHSSNFEMANNNRTNEIVVEQQQEEMLEYDGFADVNDFVVPRRRLRVYGHCRCKECGQSFANMARLERHLSVHQQYGAYLCPLCGKTYKYEYNLFYHWRRTCQDMNELLSVEERKMIEINSLRQLIEEIAEKKATIGPLELDGIMSKPIQGPDTDQLNWIQYGQSVQCSECFRSFSSIQRLEKHMAGAHYSFGTHHCLLCGGRFKYEYNLLYHYRHVCKYSLELLSKEARQQMEAADLKKTVRQIAAKREHPFSNSSGAGPSNLMVADWTDDRDSEQQQIPQMMDEHSIKTKMEMKTELGDSLVRRQMMDKIIQRYAPSSSKSKNQPNQSVASKQNILLPPVLLQPTFRPNLPDATPCPICSVTFYGIKVLARHLQAAHPNESTIWEKTLRALNADNAEGKADALTENAPKLRPSRLGATGDRKRKLPEDEQGIFEEERPPQLEMEHNKPREQFNQKDEMGVNRKEIIDDNPQCSYGGIRRRSNRTK